ncbi:MAG TPA: hypothetical protein VGG48_00075 [Rhizomicrobium sp.]
MAFACLLLLGFTLQSYVTQTHIHVGNFAVTAGFVTSNGAAGKSNPFDDEATNCLFCQEMLHAGQFVMPGAPVLALPTQFVSVVPTDLALPLFVGAIAHGWQGRAPPRV